ALNARGEVLLPVLGAALLRVGEPGPGPGGRAGGAGGEVEVVIPEPAGVQAEEDRSRRPTVFSALREVVAAMAGTRPPPGPGRAVGLVGGVRLRPGVPVGAGRAAPPAAR